MAAKHCEPAQDVWPVEERLKHHYDSSPDTDLCTHGESPRILRRQGTSGLQGSGTPWKTNCLLMLLDQGGLNGHESTFLGLPHGHPQLGVQRQPPSACQLRPTSAHFESASLWEKEKGASPTALEGRGGARVMTI